MYYILLKKTPSKKAPMSSSIDVANAARATLSFMYSPFIYMYEPSGIGLRYDNSALFQPFTARCAPLSTKLGLHGCRQSRQPVSLLQRTGLSRLAVASFVFVGYPLATKVAGGRDLHSA